MNSLQWALVIVVYPLALLGAWTLGGKVYDWTHPEEREP